MSPCHGYLTDVSGVRLGHYTDSHGQTGLSVLLFPGGATASVDVRGAAPGTRETDLLRPENTVTEIHGLLLTGGSAFGLDAAAGLMRFLRERGEGVQVGNLRVPIVPAAVIFDLFAGSEAVPGAEHAYGAAKSATKGPFSTGRVGAGTGATVGKILGMDHAAPGGVGTQSILLPGGARVGAFAVVNAWGDVISAEGRVLAGVRASRSTASMVLEGNPMSFAGGNTTLGVIVTDAALDKSGCLRVAQMAHDGLARSLNPCHTPVDGDVVFTVSTGTKGASVLSLGVAAASALADAIRFSVS